MLFSLPMDASESLFVDGEEPLDDLDVFKIDDSSLEEALWQPHDYDSESTDSEIEDVELAQEPGSFLIRIQDGQKEEERKQQRKLKRKKRLAIHNMGLLAYLTMAKKRNEMLRSKKILKTLKQLLPPSFMSKHVKVFKKLLQNPDNDADKHLIYILKYLIKWFRLNYRTDCNGLRVLGYLPDNVNPEDYYPHPPQKQIGSVSDFCRVIKRFKHNRDTGSQIFTGLLRSLGFDARLVFSLPLLPASNSCSLEQPKMNVQLLSTNKDNDLLYPYFWTELINPLNPQEVIVLEPTCFLEEEKQLVRVRRVGREFNKDIDFVDFFNPKTRDLLNVMPSLQYVVAFDSKGLTMDVSPRYMYDVAFRYFGKLDLRTDSGRSALLFQSVLRSMNTGILYSDLDNLELNFLRSVAFANLTIPQTLAGVRRNPNIVTKESLRYNEALKKSSHSITKIKLSDGSKHRVYLGNQILYGRSEQQWKFLGRSILPEQIETPIRIHNSLQMLRTKRRKLMTLNGKLACETRLYNFEQTCPFIKQEVSNGKIPRNQYGNIEIFSPIMIPTGCTWITWSYIELILRLYSKRKIPTKIQSEIEYVPVVIGFDFRTKPGYAVPIKRGVLVLNSQMYSIHHIWLSGKMQVDRQHLRLKKIRSLSVWNTLLHKLRIVQRLDKQYGKS